MNGSNANVVMKDRGGDTHEDKICTHSLIIHLTNDGYNYNDGDIFLSAVSERLK